jgi:putative ABC transport system permease protein
VTSLCEQAGKPKMSGLPQDLRYAQRQLRKNPGFTAVAVLTLSLGIGGNSAMFSVVNAVLLRPLPFHDRSRLVLVHEGIPTAGFSKIGFSAPDLMIYEQGQKSFEGMAPYQNESFELSGAEEPERITATRVSADLFSLLGIQPILGRSFYSEEDRPGVRVAVLSYGLWQSRYGGSRDVIGRGVTLDRIPYTVIGVMPRDFRFPLSGPATNNQAADLWVPIAFTQRELGGWGDMFNNDVVARLKPGVTLAEARAEADALARRILQAYPAELLKAYPNATLIALVDPMQSEVSGGLRPLLLVLQGAVGLVLLIACANVALLLLSRASAREREIAIRAAMGAARSHLVAQLLTESLLLAVAGGILGLGLAVWSKDLLLRQLPDNIGLPHEIQLDASVLLFTLLTTLLTAILFGVVPALHATRTGAWSAMQEGGRAGTGRAQHRAQGTFVIVEFGLALILLVGAGLLLRSFTKLLATDPGFQPEKVLAMSVSLPTQAYPHVEEIRNYYQGAILQISRVPGVISAAAANDLPFNGNEMDAIEVEGQDKSATPAVRQTWVLGDYLQTMGIPLLRGRLFTADDRQGTQLVTLISQSTARALWPNQDAIGKRIFRTGGWRTVVGIVGDVPDGPLSAVPMPHCYSPYPQESDALLENLRTLNLAVRTRSDPAALTASIVEQLHRLDPALAISDVRTMHEEVNDTVAPQRFNAILVGIYAGLALLLALVGIYGVLAYMVIQQTHEIGIRMALGAQRSDILRRVVGHGMCMVALGAAAGLVGAWGVTRLMESLLYGVAPRDPLTFLGVTGVLVAAALLACYVPAMRAAKVDPMVALRYE